MYSEDDLVAYYTRVNEDPAAPRKATTPRELMLEQFCVPFLIQAIKELKPEFIQIVTTP
jgi:hypothetical protein